MKLSISYRNVEFHAPLEKDVARHVEKINKLLKSYAPDLVQLHVVFAVNARKKEHSCTLHLSLPTGPLHALATGKTVQACRTKAFAELETQVKKHQALLRKDYEWKRKRPRAQEELAL